MGILNINTFSNNGLKVLSGGCTDEVFYNLITRTVVGGARTIRATWSIEMAQDVRAFHHIDAEMELTRILGEQIAQDMDGHIIRQLRNQQPTPFFQEELFIEFHRKISLPIHDRFINPNKFLPFDTTWEVLPLRVMN